MKCIYRNFEAECKWEECPARMQITKESDSSLVMNVCALAYNGTPLPNSDQKERIDELEKRIDELQGYLSSMSGYLANEEII